VCLVEKQQIPILQSMIDVTWPELDSTIYHIWGEYAHHYITDVVHSTFREDFTSLQTQTLTTIQERDDNKWTDDLKHFVQQWSRFIGFFNFIFL
jgi:hypothetical protein